MLRLEAPASAPRLNDLRQDLHPQALINGLIGFVFAASGPLAIILSVGSAAELPSQLIASWVFGCFALNGVLSVVMSWRYRMPLAFFWTIPGMVLVGESLTRLPFAEVVGAYLLSAVLMLVLGLSGWIGRIMRAIPLPIVMGMVAGVFLRFGTDLIRHLQSDLWVSGPMVLVFLGLSAVPRAARFFPPLIGALLAGALAIAWGPGSPGSAASLAPVIAGSDASILANPVFTGPSFSWRAALELVVPLAITVLVVQNGQGGAVLRAAQHQPPINAIAAACGLWSLLTACVGSVSTCLTGPTNAIVIASGPRETHYIGAMTVGVLAIIFGLLSPAVTRILLATPGAFIVVLGGLAMLRVLQAAFQSAFRERHSLGALVSFVVTVSGIQLASVGAPFWGLVAGTIVSRFLEASDYAPPTPPQ
jgi:benzoate membrane transport protein